MRRVRLKNYKSIVRCDVELAPMTFLVGRNAAGKSNFLEALSFVTEALQVSVEHALRRRGGLDQVCRTGGGDDQPGSFLIRLGMDLGPIEADYGFEINCEPEGFSVGKEKLTVAGPGNRSLGFERRGDRIITSSVDVPPAVLPDRLFLTTASGLKEFRPVFDALLSMGFYNLNPDVMRELASPDGGELLHRDGGNIASVIGRLKKEEPALFARLRDYLAQMIPGVEDVGPVTLGPKETLEFTQAMNGAKTERFYAQSMSNGTLRSLGALVAVTQLAGRKLPVRLVGLEEPESALHPAAAGALMDALSEAGDTQILVTTHSADLLDHAPLGSERARLLVVSAEGGASAIGVVDPASRQAIEQDLYSAGELLRLGQLEPDPEDLRRQEQSELGIA